MSQPCSRVMITGAAGAIGAEVARAFAGAGTRVIAIDRDGKSLEQLMSTLRGDGHQMLAVDLAATDVDGLVQSAAEAMGGLDALVHVAAVLVRRDTIFDITDEDLELQIGINFTTTFRLNRAAARVMIDSGSGGSIVNFVSQGWWTGGFGGSVIYNASKGAIVTMTRGLARTLAPHNIRVNAVSPGMVDTPMLRTGLSDQGLQDLVSATPMKRLAAPSEMTGAAVFLTSEQASFITGSVINVSGGFLMY